MMSASAAVRASRFFLALGGGHLELLPTKDCAVLHRDGVLPDFATRDGRRFVVSKHAARSTSAAGHVASVVELPPATMNWICTFPWETRLPGKSCPLRGDVAAEVAMRMLASRDPALAASPSFTLAADMIASAVPASTQLPTAFPREPNATVLASVHPAQPVVEVRSHGGTVLAILHRVGDEDGAARATAAAAPITATTAKATTPQHQGHGGVPVAFPQLSAQEESATTVYLVATHNVLYEAHYQKYCEVAVAPERERRQWLEQTLRGTAAAGADFMCLQECSLSADELERIIPGYAFFVGRPKNHETSVVGYRKSAFALEKTHVTIFWDPKTNRGTYKCGASVLLRPLTPSGGPLVAVTSAHLPWMAADPDAATVARQAVDAAFCFTPGEVRNDVVTILAGDFNMHQSRYPAAIRTFADSGMFDTTSGVAATVASASGSYDKIDFVMVHPQPAQGGSDSSVAAAVPANPAMLVKHKPITARARGSIVGVDPSDSAHDEPFVTGVPSDHALLLSTFGVHHHAAQPAAAGGSSGGPATVSAAPTGAAPASSRRRGRRNRIQ